MSVSGMLGAVLVVLGGVFLAVAALGVVTLPDALSRQHAATKSVTLAMMTLSGGTCLMVMDPGWVWRLVLLVVFLMLTVPGASHLLARAAVSEEAGRRQADLAPMSDGLDKDEGGAC